MNINELLKIPKSYKPSRKPDFILKALNKYTDQRTGKIGAAWNNKDGSISLVLDLGVQIHQEDGIVIMLFPNDRPEDQGEAPFPVKRKAKEQPGTPPTSLIHKIDK